MPQDSRPTPDLTPELIAAIAALPDGALEAAVNREIQTRRERRIDRRVEAKDRAGLMDPLPTRGRHHTLVAKRRRRNRPQVSVDDIKWIPGALRQWRTAMNMSPTQAQAAIGYSPRSSTWRDWESGRTVPPYEALLRIIARTGWVGAGDRVVIETPGAVLEVARARHQAAVARRRRRKI